MSKNSYPTQSRRPGCWVLLLVIVSLLALAGYKAIRIWPHAMPLLKRVDELRTLASAGTTALTSPERLPWAREQLGATRDDLQAIRAEIGFLLPFVERLDWLPRIGPDLAAAPALLDMGIELCDAAWWGLLGLEPALDILSKGGQAPGQSTLEALLPAFVVARPRFAEAADALARARPAQIRLWRHELSPRLAKWKGRLDAYWPVLEGVTLLAQDVPALLGQDRPVTYLILAQNNHELRPTGGFISGVGLIQLSSGRIISTTFQDSYAVDALCDLGAHPPAPQPLREYMWAPALVFRDANWSPDFPSSAAVAGSIYRLCRGTEVDGAVAMDLDTVTALLRALGPLQPEGYPEPVTGDTLLQYVNEYWTNPLRSVDITDEQKGEWWAHRKDFMADLLKAALQKLTTSPQPIELNKLGLALLQSFQARHLLVALRDPAVARGFVAAGWDGALRPAAGDYLMVVDANVGFRKVNPQVQQRMEYQVNLSVGGAPQATLALRYTNQSPGSAECIAGSRYDDSYAQMMQGCYWDYVRVFAPRGSHLLQVEGSDSAPPEASEEAGKAVFSAFLVVAPGQSRELKFTYELPPPVAGSPSSPVYRLLMQKQPGSAAVPASIGVSGGGVWQFSPSRSAAVGLSDGRPFAYGEDRRSPMAKTVGRQVQFNLAADTWLAWVDVSAEASQRTRPLLVLGAAGLVLIVSGLGLWLRARPPARGVEAGPT